MSSDKCKQYPAEDPNCDGSISEAMESQGKYVCFICGTYTRLIINIYEPRCGPNMIDVISERFKMRPLKDDKFLCYNCNNCLINWYTMQKKNDDSSHEDSQQTTSSTMSAASTANAHDKTAFETSDDTGHYDTNEMIVISDEEYDENVDVNNVIQTLRNRLKKYLYYPNKEKSMDFSEFQAHPDSTVMALRGSPDQHRNCERCGKLINKISIRQRRKVLCRHCRFSLRRNGQLKRRHTYRLKRTHLSSLNTRSATSHSHNRSNIFEKLQQLGTSIFYENDYKAKQRQMHRQQHMTSIPHEIDTNQQKSQANVWQRRTTNESNEILMTFNTVVTEVFPIDQLYNYTDQQDEQMLNKPNDNTTGSLNIQEILRNVPKSLTITMA